MASPESAWKRVTEDQLKSLLKLVKNIDTRFDRAAICEDASIHTYDFRNFLSGNSDRPRANIGIRLLAYVARQPKSDFPAELGADHEAIVSFARSIFEFDANDDYFFRYLDKIKVMSASECRRVAKLAHGNYYMYRFSNKRNVLFRSHVGVKSYTAFDRLPHFINQSKFGPLENRASPLRRAEGQILALNNTYVFVGFIFDNFEGSVSGYKGLKLFIVPSAEFHSKEGVARGIFASFTHGGGDRYEYGPMCLIRTKENFSVNNVGEFSLDRLSSIAPALNLADLRLNVEASLDQDGFLATCLALNVFGRQ